MAENQILEVDEPTLASDEELTDGKEDGHDEE